MRALSSALAVLAVALSLAAGAGARGAAAEEVTIASSDGTTLAATLHLPDVAPPAGGWPAVVFMHGLAGNRSSMNELARQMGMIGSEYAVLTFDARGHGQSQGLIGIDGPNEVADVRAVFEWLRARPDVSDTKIGAWGISLGGGAALNSLVAGVPWAAVATCITWTDLQTALMPQGLAKSGVVAGFITQLDPTRVDPAVVTARDAAFAGNLAGVAAFAGQRSSLSRLRNVSTPLMMMQGRRDFAFGLDQVLTPWTRLTGPKRLWIGNMGHAPSGFPAADTPAMLAENKRWFDRFLRDVANGADTGPPVTIAAEGKARVVRLPGLPQTKTVTGSSTGSEKIGGTGKVVRRFGPTAAPLEVFGSPTVTVEASAAGGWSRVIVVLSATTKKGEVVVAGGGMQAKPGKRTYKIVLGSQSTLIPKGATLKLTIASSSLAQGASNLLYLDLPMPAAATATIGKVAFTIPALTVPISK